jgi:hypothetical protein
LRARDPIKISGGYASTLTRRGRLPALFAIMDVVKNQTETRIGYLRACLQVVTLRLRPLSLGQGTPCRGADSRRSGGGPRPSGVTHTDEPRRPSRALALEVDTASRSARMGYGSCRRQLRSSRLSGLTLRLGLIPTVIAAFAIDRPAVLSTDDDRPPRIAVRGICTDVWEVDVPQLGTKVFIILAGWVKNG